MNERFRGQTSICLLPARAIRFQFLNFAVLFDEIVEQHRRRMAGARDLTLNAVPPLAPAGALTELESRCKTHVSQ